MAEPEAGEELTLLRTDQGQPPLIEASGRDRGIGPFRRLVLRGATVIDGTGAPPIGPIDIVVENGRIAEMRKVGNAKAPINPDRRPAPGEHEIDCHGKFVTPGFIDCHAHAGVAYHAANGWVPPVDYVYKLWLAHGVTTVREMGSFNGLGWMLRPEARLAEANRIAAPRLLAYAYFPAVNDMLKTIHTPERGARLAAPDQGARRRWGEVLRRAAGDHAGGARRVPRAGAARRAAITRRWR